MPNRPQMNALNPLNNLIGQTSQQPINVGALPAVNNRSYNLPSPVRSNSVSSNQGGKK